MASKQQPNAPCLCGSGLKYKRCHAVQEQNAKSLALQQRNWTDLDNGACVAVLEVAKTYWGTERVNILLEDMGVEHDEDGPSLSIMCVGPWAALHGAVEDQPFLDLYVQQRGERLSTAQRAWIEAQKASYFSIYEIKSIKDEAELILQDKLTNQEVTVYDKLNGKRMERYESMLARVVAVDGTHFFSALHPNPLSPLDADEVVASWKKRMKLRRKTIVPEILQSAQAAACLLSCWIEHLEEQEFTTQIVTNTDGDPYIFCDDSFSFPVDKRETVTAAIAGLKQVSIENDPKDPSYAFNALKPKKNRDPEEESTLWAHGEVTSDTVRVSTNSVKRANRFKKALLAALPGFFTAKGRSSESPKDAASALKLAQQRNGTRSMPATPEDTAEMDQALRDFKRRMYLEDWPTQPLPALGGKTPTEAAASKASRDKLYTVLKECELKDNRQNASEAFDFRLLYTALGLTHPSEAS